MSDASDIVSLVGGGTAGLAGLSWALKQVWEAVKGRNAKLEAQAETASDSKFASLDGKVDQMLAGQQRVELELRDLRNGQANQAGEVSGIRERINGISSDHGPRLKELELWRAAIDAKRKR